MGNASFRPDPLGATGWDRAAEGLRDHLADFDILRDGSVQDVKRYPAFVPREVSFRFAISGAAVSFAVIMPAILPRMAGASSAPSDWVLFLMISLGVAAWILFYLVQTPRWIVREPDALVFESRVRHHRVPLDDVLELVVLRNGMHFRQLLRRWDILPFGHRVHFFLGAPSSHDAMVVLLTKSCFWSFIFCLKDPVQFLLDNQRPLDLQATYRVAIKAVLREGESLDSQQLGAIEKGRYVKVVEQCGRRVKVQIGDDICGWISYLSNKGWFILVKERQETTAAGMIGASELARTGESAIELGLLLPVNRPGSLE
mmetsp:Transcript_13132/g.24194  ORF Transcript_13132/g.24194 Transcript_13132/m.24194 type:complete len:314 (-) Transcript_13132:59-1000(-)